MSDTASSSTPLVGSVDPARTTGREATATALLERHPERPTDGNDRCPSCDTGDAWQISRRHRFSPFGSVLLAVLAFWAVPVGWLFGGRYMPALVLLLAAIVTGLATRKAEVCKACGYVRPQGK